MAWGIVVSLAKQVWGVIDFFISAVKSLFPDFQKLSFQDNLYSIANLCLSYKSNNIVFLFLTKDEQIKEKHPGLNVNFTFFKCETR